MVATDKVHAVRVGHLEGEEVQQYFARKLPAVYIVPQEEVADETMTRQDHDKTTKWREACKGQTQQHGEGGSTAAAGVVSSCQQWVSE